MIHSDCFEEGNPPTFDEAMPHGLGVISHYNRVLLYPLHLFLILFRALMQQNVVNTHALRVIVCGSRDAPSHGTCRQHSAQGAFLARGHYLRRGAAHMASYVYFVYRKGPVLAKGRVIRPSGEPVPREALACRDPLAVEVVRPLISGLYGGGP